MAADLPNRWTPVLELSTLRGLGRKVVKVEGKQILLIDAGDRILACNNRCPHEGYPLSEGTIAEGEDKACVLTCNWHNWKFDLDGGETLVGGDKLRRYPTRIVDGVVEVDVADAPRDQIIKSALDNLEDSFDRHEYDRMAREIARLMKAGGDPLDAVRRAVIAASEKLEFGATHALPASADWLSRRVELLSSAPKNSRAEVRSLSMVTECVGHFAWDTRREPVFPYPMGETGWDGDAFVTAVEAEDENSAIALVRGAISAGLNWSDLEPAFARAALAHYADFGHSAIYTYKMRALSQHLQDRESLLALCLQLTRSLVYATREDLIPEFKAYGGSLSNWDGKGNAPIDPTLFRTGSVAMMLQRISASSGSPVRLYDALMAAGAWQMLHMDLRWPSKTDGSVAQNVGWLDFTHCLTFGNAARKLCEAYPVLWPNALLQLGCFLGRNSAFTDPDLDVSEWVPKDPLASVEASLTAVEDHGWFEYIVSAHLLKLSFALREELIDRPGQDWHPMAIAALTRFLNEPLKRKHTLRTAHQALEFVALEG